MASPRRQALRMVTAAKQPPLTIAPVLFTTGLVLLPHSACRRQQLLCPEALLGPTHCCHAAATTWAVHGGQTRSCPMALLLTRPPQRLRHRSAATWRRRRSSFLQGLAQSPCPTATSAVQGWALRLLLRRHHLVTPPAAPAGGLGMKWGGSHCIRSGVGAEPSLWPPLAFRIR